MSGNDVFPKFRFPPKGKIIVSSENFAAEIDSEKALKLNILSTSPRVLSSETIETAGWIINVVALVDSRATSEVIVNAWELMNRIIPMKELMIPFLYSTVLRYVKTGIADIEPHWAKLFRLCFWYQKCKEHGGTNFHYKETELKRAMVLPLRNSIRALYCPSTFPKTVEELSKTVTSYTSEFKFPSLAFDNGHKIDFDKKHDFYLNDFAAEVKSVYSRISVTREPDGIPVINIHGHKFEEPEKSDLKMKYFVGSKKVFSHIGKAYTQGGQFVFIDVTHTFASQLLFLISNLEKTDLLFSNALDTALSIAKSEERFPVVVSSSIDSIDHQRLLACVVPIPLEWLRKDAKNGLAEDQSSRLKLVLERKACTAHS